MELLLAIIALGLAITVLVQQTQQCRRIDRVLSHLADLGGRVARLERSAGPPAPPPHATVAESGSTAQPNEAMEGPALEETTAKACEDRNTEPGHGEQPQETATWAQEPMAQDVRPAADQDWWTRLEKAAGIRWTTWVGATVLILGAGLFVKYAFDQRWLGPSSRVILGVLAGLVFLAAGERLIRSKMRVLGQGLVGVGLASLYVSLYAAYGFYNLVAQPIVFGLMIAVTAAGMALAVAHDAMAIGVLAILGGFLTPCMLSTGRDSRDALFAYVLLLDLGVLAATALKRWRTPDILAFCGTWILFWGWYVQFKGAPTFSLAPTAAWVLGFFLVFLLGPVTYPLRSSTAVRGERLLMAAANGAVAFGWIHALLHPGHRLAFGLIGGGMSAAYLLLAVLIHRRNRPDSRASLAFFVLAVAAAVGTAHSELWLWLDVAGHHDCSRWVTSLVWAAGATALVIAAIHEASAWTFACGLLCWAVAASLCIWGYARIPMGQWKIVLNGRFAASCVTSAALAAYGGMMYRYGLRMVSSQRDTLRLAERLFGLSILALAGFCSAELWYWTASGGDLYLSRRLLVGVWCLAAWAAMGLALRLRLAGLLVEGLLALGAAFVIGQGAYHGTFRDAWVYLNARHGVCLFVVVTTMAYARACGRLPLQPQVQRSWASGLYAVGTVALLLLLSVETYEGFRSKVADPRHAEWLAQMAVSVVWGLFAAAMLVLGFMWHVRPLRLGALALFGLCATKLAVVDLASVQQVYRIISFVALGGLMIGASYLYHSIERSKT